MAIAHASNTSRKRIVGTLIAVAMVFLVAAGAHAQDQANGSQRFVSIDFNNVDISVFIKFISELTGKNFVIDQRVKGKVTIISPSKISVGEAYKVFESVLDVHGFATVETGKLIKIIPSPDARTKNIETRTRAKGDSDDDQVVTQLMPLRYADPNEIKRLFTPMVSKSSVILSYDPTNTLIITDNYSNIARLMKILKTIDIPGVGREITVFPIHNADASKLVSLLDTVFKTSTPTPPKKGAAASDRGAAFVADERTNSIIMVASEDHTNRIRSLIETLDQETPKGKGKDTCLLPGIRRGRRNRHRAQRPPQRRESQNRRRQTGAGGFRQGEHYGGQGHQQPDHHRRPGRLCHPGGNHPPDRYPPLHGLHRSVDHGGQCRKKLRSGHRMGGGRRCLVEQ